VWDPWNGFFQTGVEPRLSSESCWNFVQLKFYGPRLFNPSFIKINEYFILFFLVWKLFNFVPWVPPQWDLRNTPQGPMEQFLIINNKQQLSRWCLPNFLGMLFHCQKLTIKNQFALAKLLLFYIYKFNVQMWKMFIIWVLCQCYFATFEQNSFRIIQKRYNFRCMSYYMCKLRR